MDINYPDSIEKEELEKLKTRKGFIQMCLNSNYKIPGINNDSEEEQVTKEKEEDELMQDYDPNKPNDYEQMLLRKRRIEK